MGLLNSMVSIIWAQHIFSHSFFFFFLIGIELSIKINNTNIIIQREIIKISKFHNDFRLVSNKQQFTYTLL